MTALPSSIAPAIPAGARDFGDWLSPMLVKELRQGMRAKVFVLSFLVLQLALLLLAVVGLTASASQESQEGITAAFWAIVSVPLLLVLPSAALNSVADEAKANTLELIFLTRLSARRIVYGKWIALLAQALLFVTAVLPYVVLRYFLGGVDLLQELLYLALLTFSSGVLMAVAVGLSPFVSKLVRALLLIGFIVMMNVGGIYLLEMLIMSRFTGFIGPLWKTWLSILPAAVAVTVFALEIGAARLAPAAENHTTPLRLIALITFVLGLFICVGISAAYSLPCVIVGTGLLFLTAIAGLCEDPARPPALYRSFVRLGFLGRVAGRFFYPGWPAAVLFSLLAVALWLAIIGPSRVLEPTPLDYLRVLLALGTLWMPRALLQIFNPETRRVVIWYLIIIVFSIVAYSVTSIIHALKGPDLEAVASLLPPAAFIASLSDSVAEWGTFKRPSGVMRYAGALFLTATFLFALLLKMIPVWRAIAAAEKKARPTQAPRAVPRC